MRHIAGYAETGTPKRFCGRNPSTRIRDGRLLDLSAPAQNRRTSDQLAVKITSLGANGFVSDYGQVPINARPKRYRPDDQLLAFLKGL